MKNHDEPAILDDARWWRSRVVAFAIGFRMMVLWMISSTLFLAAGVILTIVVEKRRPWGSLLDVVSECGWGSLLGGMGVGIVFGIPLGIVSVLGARERLLELEQALEQETGSSK